MERWCVVSSHIKLKSCPFCGGEAQLLMVGKRADGGDEWYVGCENLHCSLHPHSTVPYASAEIAAEAWNRRADNTRSAPVGDTAALREALVKIEKMAHCDLCNVYPKYRDKFNDMIGGIEREARAALRTKEQYEPRNRN